MTAAPVVALAAGADHSCALLGSGGVDCWGADGDGQLGAGVAAQRCSGDACSPVPVPVAGVAGASALAAGGEETCAIVAGGAVQCWGANGSGQLGGGPGGRVRGVAGAVAVAVGADHACAIVAAGAVECWGANDLGQLGDGPGRGGGPVAVRGLAGAVALAAGGEETCAIVAGGAVECWGANGFGELGDGTSRGPDDCAGRACAWAPAPVRGVAGAVAVAVGNDHACALLARGSALCWGYDFAAELGAGTSSGPQWCAGGGWCATTPVAVLGLAGATAIAAGGDHTCALLTGGGVDCWGFDSFGQLGVGTSAGPQTCYWQLVRCAKSAVAVRGLATASAIAAGGDHSCALVAGAAVDCWGSDWFGELGAGASSSCDGDPCSTTPVAVSFSSPGSAGTHAPAAAARTRTPASSGRRS
jgi:alpha-tubulin suppressor-like RCC1 family protein